MSIEPIFYVEGPLRSDDELIEITHDFLIDKLAASLKAAIDSAQTDRKKIPGREYTSSNIKPDLYANIEGISIAYECTLSDISTGELVQALQYTHSCRQYGPAVDSLVFVGLNINPAIKIMVENINKRNHMEGINTRIALRTWSDFGINLFDNAA